MCHTISGTRCSVHAAQKLSDAAQECKSKSQLSTEYQAYLAARSEFMLTDAGVRIITKRLQTAQWTCDTLAVGQWTSMLANIHIERRRLLCEAGLEEWNEDCDDVVENEDDFLLAQVGA